MRTKDKMKAAADKVTGQVKETIGKTTDNDKLVAEGKADQAKGIIRDKIDVVKEMFET